MSDELKLEVAAPDAPQVVEAPVAPGAGEVDITVQEATEQGWRPKEDWIANGGDPDEWKPAKLFLKDGELYKSIHSTKRELKQTQAALNALQGHHRMVFEKAHQQAIDDLRKERRQAMRNENFEELEEVENRIEKITAEHNKERAQMQQIQAQAPQVPVEFEQWKAKNPWFDNDMELKEFAEATGLVYLQRNPGAAPTEVLKHIDNKMRQHYSEKFGVKRAAPNAVAPVSKQQAPNKSGDSFQLDDAEKEIMNTFVRSGVMTKEQYIADLKKVKGRS